MSVIKRIAVIGVAAASLVAAGLATAPGASADTAYGCNWPRVCFYLTDADWNARVPTAAYQDITSSPQNLGSRSYNSEWAFNSRNDDGALLYYTNGSTLCLRPNNWVDNNDWVVNKIRIMDSPTC
ncbi:hypothetical protein [Streptomyces sp. NPDC059894]|uniref:hypothetical protein n=1 Tax=unclassified Streptomyces TaxID=2593676 RepID=UPI00365C117D